MTTLREQNVNAFSTSGLLVTDGVNAGDNEYPNYFLLISKRADGGHDILVNLADSNEAEISEGIKTNPVVDYGCLMASGSGCRQHSTKYAVYDNDGNFLEFVTTSATGEVDTVPAAYFLGIPFDQELTTLPAHVTANTGDNIYLKKRIVTAYVDLYHSYNVNVNGVPLFGWTLPITLDSPSKKTSDIFKIPMALGWKRRTNLEIAQPVPLHTEIRGVAYSITI
jgi:hypothetical protein